MPVSGSVPEPSPEPSPMINVSIRRRGRKHAGHPSQWFNPPVITVRTHKIDLSGVHFFALSLEPQTRGPFWSVPTAETHVVIPGFSISGCDVLRAAKGRSHTTRPAGGQAYLQGTLLHTDRHNLRCQNIYPLQHKLRYRSFPGLFRYAAAKPEASLYTQLIFPLQDVKLTASNDDYYFVFEDFLYQVHG